MLTDSRCDTRSDVVEEWYPDAAFAPPIPDAVDLVLEAATLEAAFAADRLARVHAMRRGILDAEATGRGAGVTDLVERSVRLELAAAMRITEHAAGRMIRHAEALVERYPGALDSLGHGGITTRHCEILVDHLDVLPLDVRAPIVADAVALAEGHPVGTFRRALRALIDTVQAKTLEERHRHALRDRRIAIEHGEDGMGVLLLFAPSVELHAIHGRATSIAKGIKGNEGETRSLDQVRTDVLCDLLIEGITESMPAHARGIRASVVVTVPVVSLLDHADAASADPAVVEGVGPIPLSTARELCGGESSWMRVLTHPETGMVLSVGRDRYSPPAALRKLVRWRADRCMGPGCGMPASRCEIDHQVRWADGGETSLENTSPFCKNHHLIKDNTDWRVRQLPRSGGAIEWVSPTGRRYVVQPERRVPVFRPSAAAGSIAVDASAEAPF